MKPFSFLLFTPAAAALNCRPSGPALPRPLHLADAAYFRRAAVNLAHTYDALTSDAASANLSFSVAVVSADQDENDGPLWEYHYRSAANVDGTEHVDADSQYLVGSISKVVTDYVLLVAGLDLDAPVKTYLPLLSGGAWDDITLRMLASHTAGVATNYGFSDFYFLKDVYLALGFPPLHESDYPPCGVTGLNSGCTAEQLQRGLAHSYPVVAPGSRPSYSNAAFSIIALAVEAHTGLSYAEQVAALVAAPLRLTATRPSPGDAHLAVIPPGDSGWGADYGVNAPAGGLVSSAGDLGRLARAVLARTLPGLSAARTRQWLKPASYADGSGGSAAVGAPWEIRRYDLAPDNSAVVYAKDGTAPLYSSRLALVDEYGVGVVVLTAGGPPDALGRVYDAALSAVVGAAHDAARAHAKAEYARSFTSSDAGNDTTAVTARFALDEEGSLVLSALTRGGADILAGWRKVWNETLGAFGPRLASDTVRLFPTELTVDGDAVGGEVWRLWPDAAAGGADDDCPGWMLGDWVHYGGEPLDRVVFYREGARVTGLEVPFLRSGVLKPV